MMITSEYFLLVSLDTSIYVFSLGRSLATTIVALRKTQTPSHSSGILIRCCEAESQLEMGDTAQFTFRLSLSMEA